MSTNLWKCVLSLFILMMLATACALPALSPTTLPSAPLPAISETQTSSLRARCGDGVCNGPENPRNCPADCAAQTTTPVHTPTATASAPTAGRAVLYLGIMVHLEGWPDGENQDGFNRHAALVRAYADLFEAYEARLTLESKEFTEGRLRWGDNVLLEMEERGHGIGVHADIGGNRNYDCNQFAPALRREKEQLESLGVTVRHVSGIVSHCDWVTAAAEAGYLFTTGQVAYSVMSLPAELRPPEYRDCPNPAACHQPFPTDLRDRMHPWRTRSGSDWLRDDREGRLVLLPSSGALPCMQEESGPSGASVTKCDFTQEDIDAFIRQLEEALSYTKPDQVNIYYVAWSLGAPLDPTLLERWLQSIQPYVESGQVQWMTLPQMYDEYVRWEREH